MEFIHEENRVYLLSENGQMIAEVTFPEISKSTVGINRTFVDESLRGKGIASKLMYEAYSEIKNQQKKAKPVCSYAIGWFEKNIAYSDILDD